MTITMTNPQVESPARLSDEDAQHMRDLFVEVHQYAAQDLQDKSATAITEAITQEIDKGLRDPQSRMATPPNRLFLIRDSEDHEIIAYCSIVQRDHNTVELKNVVCSPQHQGQGLGHRMMQAVEEHTRTMGYQMIYLWTYGHLAPALRLYERRGYVRTGIEPPRDASPDLEQIHMVLDL